MNRCPYFPTVPDSERGSGDSVAATDKRNDDNTTKVMMYIFPRQFGLHNVFTSTVDHTKTTQKLQDYTLREEEIAKKFGKPKGVGGPAAKVHIPKRLRGDAKRLVERLKVLHHRCSYAEMLRHYCPTALDSTERRSSGVRKSLLGKPEIGPDEGVVVSGPRRPKSSRNATSRKIKGRKGPRPSAPAVPTIKYTSLVEIATPAAQVSAFCQAVLAKIIPNEFWGTGQAMAHNKATVLQKVDHFVKLRRYETMSLHEVMQGLKVNPLLATEICVIARLTRHRSPILSGSLLLPSRAKCSARRTLTSAPRS